MPSQDLRWCLCRYRKEADTFCAARHESNESSAKIVVTRLQTLKIVFFVELSDNAAPNLGGRFVTLRSARARISLASGATAPSTTGEKKTLQRSYQSHSRKFRVPKLNFGTGPDAYSAFVRASAGFQSFRIISTTLGCTPKVVLGCSQAKKTGVAQNIYVGLPNHKNLRYLKVWWMNIGGFILKGKTIL